MIQELVLGDRKISNPFSSTCPSSTSPLLSTNTSIATTPPCTTTIVNLSSNSGGANNGNNSSNNNSNSNNNSESNGNNQNLRCPRCDSTNTKFCYYNNYNLTQPRHFCKTCRRYWTKGGTLRNVPIGGGCRKNKSTISSNNSSISSSSMSSKSSTSSSFLAKIKANTLTSEMLVNDHHNSLFLGNGFSDHPIHSPGPSPLPWSSLPQSQNSHILALLRGSTPFSNPNNPNPNPNPNPTSNVFTSLGLDSYGNGAPSLLGSFTRNNNNHLLNGFTPNLMDSNNNESNNNNNNNNGGSNIMDLYQRLKSSSTTNYGYSSSNNENNHGSLILGHMVGTTSSSSMNTSIYDAGTTPFGGGGDHLGGYGLMNSNHGISSWNDFPAVPINGTYP